MRHTFWALPAFERFVATQHICHWSKDVMNESRKICGRKNVRRFTRTIAYVQFVLNFLLALTIIVNYFDNWNARGDVIQSLRKKYRYDDEFDELNYELGVFYRITFLVLIMISCVYLKKATYVHNLAYIKFYMILQVADLLTTFLTCAVTSIRLGGAEIFTIASLVFVMNSYMLRITYKFYNEEIIMGKSLSIQIASTVNSPPNHDIRCRRI
ncbi:uncharacterized protein LOC112690551 [Sipha flava]|uniref:Uncharacterized protein LOC112690551 n=1 Tax=Sipha flava TaxID=143950 RepID=A0A8B8GCN7_9HEMI|nr:uncharacterized protein LOC112690551 [Sipha flava]